MNCKYLIIGFWISFYVSSCTSYKKVVYFNDLNRDSISQSLARNLPQNYNEIQVNDILSIRISSLNPADVQILNPSFTGTGTSGYLVDKEGNVKIPMIGNIIAKGLTVHELEIMITNKLRDFTKDPVVIVRYLSAPVTILGDVGHPGEFRSESERFTILEAIGYAGDLRVSARRDNILIVREENGERKVGRINLTSKDAFNSPYFYLKPKDVVYVEPVRASYADRSDIVSRYIGVGASLVSIILSVILLLRK